MATSATRSSISERPSAEFAVRHTGRRAEPHFPVRRFGIDTQPARHNEQYRGRASDRHRSDGGQGRQTGCRRACRGNRLQSGPRAADGRDQLDLQGTIVPAYALNSIIGNIPVIGSLLLGGEGQGLFAANYRVTGSAADPEVSVNPLSALAPGFLRRLFQPNFGMPPPVQQSLGVQ